MQTPQIQAGVFKDCEQWCDAVRDWNLDFRQLDTGPLEARLNRAVLFGLVVQEVILDRRFHQTGHSPPGVLSFGLPGDANLLDWYGSSAKPGSVMNFNRRNGFDAVSEAGFSATTLSMPTELLVAEAQMLGYSTTAEQIADGAQQFLANPKEDLRIRRVSQAILASLSRDPPITSGIQELESDLRQLIISVVVDDKRAIPPQTRARREQAVRRALEIIRATNGMIPLAKVCEYAAVSDRTLNRAFKLRFGVSPKRYTVATRFCAARKSLRNAGTHTRIADVAYDLGFWHLGRFASDYSNMFAELPSETVFRALNPGKAH